MVAEADKRGAVLSLLLDRTTVLDVAVRYGVMPETVKRWIREYGKAAADLHHALGAGSGDHYDPL